MSRHLASIRTVKAIDPIPGRDRIVLATVDGWHVIVRKDEYQVGDMCVYIEPDSVLPEREEFEFLRSKNFTIKTMKMAGVISQGICFPLSILTQNKNHYHVGDDVTEELGITHCVENADDVEPAKTVTHHNTNRLMRYGWYRKLYLLRHPKQVKGFPDFISKTDEERIQNCPWVLEDKDKIWIATEKVDGTSMTVAMVKHKRHIIPDAYEFIVCSRNRRLSDEDDGSHYWKVVKKYDIENVLKKIINVYDLDWVALQGEVIGPKIQGNKYHVSDVDFYVFNMIWPTGRKPSDVSKGLIENYGLKHVPLVTGYIRLPNTVDDVLAMAHDESEIGDTIREGLVFRDYDGRGSFKAVDPEFLLKYNAG